LDPIGLVDRIVDAVMYIDAGRRGFAANKQDARIFYERGIAQALSAFLEVQTSGDPHTIILAEYTFISQELQFCDKTDRDAIGSLTQAIQGFDDAFLVLGIVDDGTLYKAVDKAFPHHKDYRVSGFPKDAFHIACRGHATRIKNILRSPGVDGIEKALLKQRAVNLTAAQNGYTKKQKAALGV